MSLNKLKALQTIKQALGQNLFRKRHELILPSVKNNRELSKYVSTQIAEHQAALDLVNAELQVLETIKPIEGDDTRLLN
jgi:hypothetical protein